ncbi:MAG: PspC domain-containing protein [Candidatus Saccharimonadales bacterium]
MNKVTTISLGDQVYRLEEPGYNALRTYLDAAGSTLVKNPDKAEIIADIEQALADKLSRLTSEDQALNETQVKGVIERMGSVEADDSAKDTKASTTRKDGQKRLFVIREGAVALGVCKGLGAYFGWDVNTIRIIFVVLTLVTSGFWILVYLVLALILPRASTDKEIAEAYGRPVTTQDIINRARNASPNPEAFDDIVGLSKKLVHFAATYIHVVAAILLSIVTIIWATVLWQFILGKLHLHGQLQSIDSWQVITAIITAYATIAIPLFLLSNIFSRVADRRKKNRATAIVEHTAVVVWWFAAIIIVMLISAHSADVKLYVDSHQGYMDVGSHHVCVDNELCNGKK